MTLTQVRLMHLAALSSLATALCLSTAAQAQPDHYLCYRANLTSGNICSSSARSNAGGACATDEDCGGTEGETDFCIPNKFPRDLQVSLTDQYEDKDFDVKKPVSLCTPADKNAEGVYDPFTHLKGYQIKEVARSCTADAPSNAKRVCTTEEGCGGAAGFTIFCQATPEHVPQTGLRVRNQFHPAGSEIVVDTIKPDRLLVPTAKDLGQPVDPPGGNAHNVNHYKCYTVEVTPGTPVFTPVLGVLIDDQFIDPAKLFNLERPTRLCTPVDKNGEGIKDAAAHLMCYQAKPSGAQPEHVKVLGIHVNNQFGPERLDTVKEDELCVPSETLVACEADFADCNGNPADGCEANVSNNPNNCGACGTVCSSVNGAPSCTAGACQIACDADFADCNGSAADGCETNVSGDANNCGACGTVCSSVNGTSSCEAGACQIACHAGFGNCNGNASDGCETDISGDENNCGACGHACAGGETCQSGVCVAAPTCGPSVCRGVPTDTCTDADNCGSCGAICILGCSAGRCTF